MPKEDDAYKQIAFEQAKNVMPIWRSGLQGRPPRRRRRRSQVLFRSATRETTPEVSNSMDKSQQVDRLPKESWREDSPSWQHQFCFLFHPASSILSKAPMKQVVEGRERSCHVFSFRIHTAPRARSSPADLTACHWLHAFFRPVRDHITECS